MKELRITETVSRKRLGIIASSLSQIFRVAGVKARYEEGDSTAALIIEIPEHYLEFVFAEVREKLADVIVVGYKYDFFMQNTQFWGLTAEQKELFLTAVIAADYLEDRRFAQRAIILCQEISIDGIYHFKLQKLTEKWQEICTCLPSYFGEEVYRSFMQYLIDDFSDSSVYLVGEMVYDKRYGKRNLSLLLSEKHVPNPAQEILLCCAKNLHVVGEEESSAMPFVKDFYGKNVRFYSGEKLGL
ncbi:MAG: hypothetical protein E7363_00830 [Clostridiales bacterium]|nr:hypothetical protein [Clostridiales bacterium]